MTAAVVGQVVQRNAVLPFGRFNDQDEAQMYCCGHLGLPKFGDCECAVRRGRVFDWGVSANPTVTSQQVNVDTCDVTATSVNVFFKVETNTGASFISVPNKISLSDGRECTRVSGPTVASGGEVQYHQRGPSWPTTGFNVPLEATASQNGCIYKGSGQAAKVCVAACAYTVSEIQGGNYADVNANGKPGAVRVLIGQDGDKALINAALTATPAFQMKLYSTTSTTGTVNPNGVLSLGSFIDWSFPYPSSPLPKVPVLAELDKDVPFRDSIFPFWTDLVTGTNGVTYTTLGSTVGSRRFLVTWDAAYIYNQLTSSLSFSVVFYEDKTYVDVVYGPFNNGNVPTTVYVENGPSMENLPTSLLPLQCRTKRELKPPRAPFSTQVALLRIKTRPSGF